MKIYCLFNKLTLNGIVTICLLITAFSIPSYAEYNLSGEVYHDSQVLTGNGIYEENSKGEFIKSISRLELEIKRIDEDGFNLLAEFRGTYDHLDPEADDVTKNEYDEFELREAYFSVMFGSFELKAGKTIVNWGRADDINPIDLANPEDFSEFYTIDKIDRKIPVLMIDAAYFVGNMTLEAVYIPFFEPAVIPDTGPWAQYGFRQLRDLFPDSYGRIDFQKKDDEGKKDIENSETAVRLSGIFGSFDMGLVFFYGYNDYPALSYTPDSDGQPIFDVTYEKFRGYGTDFEYTIAGYGFRGEILFRDNILYALTPTMEGLVNEKAVDVQSVIGLDKFYGENFYVNIQMIFNRIFDYKAEMVSDRNYRVVSATFEEKFLNEELLTAIDISYGLDEEDWMITPRVEYYFTYDFVGEIGAYFFAGDEDTQAGQFKENDMVYVRLTYAF